MQQKVTIEPKYFIIVAYLVFLKKGYSITSNITAYKNQFSNKLNTVITLLSKGEFVKSNIPLIASSPSIKRKKNTTAKTIETILYESRQHKRNGRESLDCAVALQELVKMNVNCIITFDAHNVDVRQAIPLTAFDNIIPTEPMLTDFVMNEDINYENLLAISPDEGAMGRTRFYSGMLGCDIGMFYKRRDYSKVDEHGKNPIAEHVYLGKNIKNGEYLIIDDMISSGGSIIDILNKIKNKNPKKVWVMATFALFTEGVNAFDQAYDRGILTRVYCSNFTDVPKYIREKPWFRCVDCSKTLTEALVTHAAHQPMSPMLNGKKELFNKIKCLKESK